MTENTNTLTTDNTEAKNILGAAQEDAAFDKILKFKKGAYLIGDDPVPLGTEYLAHAVAWTKTWTKFADDKVVWRKVYRVAHGERPPQREDLDDLDETKWPRGRDGRPLDPYVFQYLLPLENLTTGEVLIFVTPSIGGRQAVSALCKEYAKRKIKGQNGQPIIQLAVGEMPTKNFGNVPCPVFEIVSWDDTGDGLAATEASLAAAIPVQPTLSTKKAAAKNNMTIWTTKFRSEDFAGCRCQRQPATLLGDHMADNIGAFPSLQTVARALGGEINGGQVLAPGPGHRHTIEACRSSWTLVHPMDFLSTASALTIQLCAAIMCASGLTFPPSSQTAVAVVAGQPKTWSECCSKRWRSRPPANRRASLSRQFDYRDSDDTLLYQVLKYDPKDFSQRRPDGKGRWIWKLSRPACPLSLAGNIKIS